MRRRTSIPQIIAWVIFVIENYLVINYGIQNLFHPKSGSAIPDTTMKVMIYAIVIGIALAIQILTLVAIFKMNDEKQGWLIVLAIMALIHDPFYFVPVIWTFVINKRTQK